MRADRLRILAAFLLDRVPGEHFRVGIWGQEGFARRECGTAACALGWATICFPEDGLRMDYSEAGPSGGTVVYGDTFGFDAARSFFEIPLSHATWLFATPGRRNDVARRLLAYTENPDGVFRELVERSLQGAGERAERFRA